MHFSLALFEMQKVKTLFPNFRNYYIYNKDYSISSLVRFYFHIILTLDAGREFFSFLNNVEENCDKVEETNLNILNKCLITYIKLNDIV